MNTPIIRHFLVVLAWIAGGYGAAAQPVAKPISFDGNNNHASVTNQAPGVWQYYQVTVPADTNLLGWDVRLVNVTAGLPQMVVRRDTFPTNLSTISDGDWPYFFSYNPWLATTWNSGDQWEAGDDWTGEPDNPNGSNADVNTLAMGMGNPLQAGTYYIGVMDPNSTNSFTLMSRGIGATNTTSYSLTVSNLNFAGSVTGTNLAPREAAYYQVVIPTNTPSWRVRLAPTAGDAALVIQKDFLPNVEPGGSAVYGSYAPDGGIELQKAGNEHYLLLPQQGGTNVPAGIYYLGVVSEGANSQLGHTIGSNTTSYVLQSLGSLTVTNLGTVTPGSDLAVTLTNLEGGDVAAYQFTVPSNLWNGSTSADLTVSLTNITAGSPNFYMQSGANIPGYGPGIEGGMLASSYGTNSVLLNPAAGAYTLQIQSYPADTAFTLRIHVQVTAGPAPRPVITSISLSGANLAINGTNGESGVSYYVLTTTNLAQPISQWTPVATNVPGTTGNFTIIATNVVNPKSPRQFYILQAQ